MNRKNRKNGSDCRPIIRLRSMLLGIIAISALIAGPLLMVWKQVYITSASVRMEHLADSLSQLSKQIATLELRCERLSSNERIERIARAGLDLEYPGSDQIVIVRIPGDRELSATGWPRDLVAFIKRSLLKERG